MFPFVVESNMPPKKKARKSHTASESGAAENSEASQRSSRESEAITAAPLMRDDIPTIVREVARQLRPDGVGEHSPLVPRSVLC